MDRGHVSVHHHLNEFFERRAGYPSEFLLSKCGVANEQIHLCGAEELGIGSHTNHAVLVGGDGVNALARPGQFHANVRERQRDHVAHAVRATGRHDVIARLVLLQHAPLHLNVVAGETPVSLGIDVADPQAFVKAMGDAGSGHGDFACHEFKASAWAFVVEENASTSKHVVGFTVVSGDFKGEHFGTAVG